MAQCAEPVIVNGLLRRHFVANVAGLGRRSQAAVLEYVAAQGAIELITQDGEQLLRRPPNGEGTITDASAVAEPDALTYTSAVAEPVARMGVAQFCANGGLAARRQVPHIQLQVCRRPSDQHRHDDVVHQPP